MTEPLRHRDDALGKLLARAKEGSELPRPGAQQRVWRALQAPPRRSAAWLLVPLAAAAAAIAAFVLFSPNEAPSPFATVTLASGDVQSSSGSTWSTAKAGQALPDGAQLKVATKSRAFARLPGAGALLREGTRASLSRHELALEDGTLVAAAKSKLRARAKEYRVDVDSALFQLEAAADAVTLHVADGEARVTGPSTDVVVKKGQRWSSRAGLSGQAAIAPADVATVRALAAGAGDEAVLRITKPAGAQVTLDGVELGTAPLEVVASRGTHQVAGVQGSLRMTMKASVGGLTIVELPQPQPLPLPDVTFEPMDSPPEPQTEPAPAPKKIEPPADPAKRYLLARSLAQQGRVAEALQIYEGLARGDSGWAEPSLYEVGRLNLRALKKPRAALAAIDDYRARYPRGSLAHEVALSSIEVQLKLGAGEAALRELDDFLARFPSSERKGDVRFLRATVRRDRGDCAGAAADYAELFRDPVHAGDALYFAAVCEQQLGEEAAARRHLTEYLERFPSGAYRDEVRRFFEGGL